MPTALVFGATGLVGGLVVRELLADDRYDRVTIVVRRPTPLRHAKLATVVADFERLADVADQLVADDLFIALGTTKAKVPDPAAYRRIDHDYAVQAAELAKARGASGVFLVSAVGADAAASTSYLRLKGETERDVAAVGLPRTHVFRPSMLIGRRAEHRPLERALVAVWPVVDRLLVGRLARFRGMRVEVLARAMVAAGRLPAPGVHVHEWAGMTTLAAGRPVAG